MVINRKTTILLKLSIILIIFKKNIAKVVCFCYNEVNKCKEVDNMITLFLSPSCTSCRKARAWLKKHEVEFKEHNIITSPLNHDELMSILSFTENGTDDIISTRSKVFQKLDIDVDDLSISELIILIGENPSLLRRPIIMNDKMMQIGYNEDEIRAFLSRSYRKQELKDATIRAEIERKDDV